MRRILAAAALAIVLAAGPVAAAAGNGPGPMMLQDMSGYSWAAPGIYAVMAQGWMLGTGPGRFGPNFVMTRAQAATVLGRAAGWQPGPAAGLPFRDAASIPAWAQGYVGLAYRVGWMHGVSADQLAPNDSLTWPALAVMAARALELPAVPNAQVAGLLATLPDGAATPGWAQQAVAQLVQARLLVGTLASQYSPTGDVTRAQMAMFMYQVQQVMPGVLPGMASTQVITGTVVSVAAAVPGTPASITVKTATGSQTFQLSANLVVLVGGAESTLSALTPGTSVTLVISPTQRVVLITA